MILLMLRVVFVWMEALAAAVDGGDSAVARQVTNSVQSNRSTRPHRTNNFRCANRLPLPSHSPHRLTGIDHGMWQLANTNHPLAGSPFLRNLRIRLAMN